MSSRTTFITTFSLLALILLPTVAHAAGLFSGHIIPDSAARCPGTWGLLVAVINNIMQFAVSFVIAFVFPLMIAYAGAMYVLNPINASGRSKAHEILKNAIIGLVISLSAWLIVDALMATLYSPGSVGTTWMNLLRGTDGDWCIRQEGAPAGTGSGAGSSGPLTVVAPVGSGSFTYQSGIRAQLAHASPALSTLLSCMQSRVPAGVGQISSISDSLILGGQKTFVQCAQGGCAHSANSCHYGGSRCTGQSYAVDFGDEQNMSVLMSAAQACGGRALNEGNHVHVSASAASSCGCGNY